MALLVTMPRPWRRHDPGVGQGAEGHRSPSEPVSALRCNTLGAVNTSAAGGSETQSRGSERTWLYRHFGFELPVSGTVK